MIELILKIVIKTNIPINLTLEQLREFPTHDSSYVMFEEKMMIVKYKPTADFYCEGFEAAIKKQVKKQYKAHSIEVLNRELKEITK